MKGHPALRFGPQWNGDAIGAQYEAVKCGLKSGAREADALLALQRWEKVRREVAAWKAVTEIRARQDVFDKEARRQTQELARLASDLDANDTQIKNAFLHSAHRDAIESVVGGYALARWQADVMAFNPEIKEQLEIEAALRAEYVQLLGQFSVSFDGLLRTPAQLSRFREHPDRDVRQAALHAEWSPYEDHQEQLDRIFDRLVHVRAGMANKCGYENFTALAYRRLGRIDYGVNDVRALRDEIHANVIPLVAALIEGQAHSLNVAVIEPWDTGVFGTAPEPTPELGAAQILPFLQRATASMHPNVGAFVESLRAANLLDIEDRPGKVQGAFCNFLPHISMPYVVTSLNGSARAITSLAHELGHAFQNFQSRHRLPLDYVVPTNETGEIHSLALEFLLWPFYDDILGENADRFRANHLRTLLYMLPYIAAIDHFQEIVYSNPECAPAERNEIWRRMEQRYMPWRTDGGIPALCRGAAWQAQRHVYLFPFYYIDYAMAMCCALDLWSESQTNYGHAIEKYLELCNIGGSMPFRSFLRAAGMRSPFQPGLLTGVVNAAAATLR